MFNCYFPLNPPSVFTKRKKRRVLTLQWSPFPHAGYRGLTTLFENGMSHVYMCMCSVFVYLHIYRLVKKLCIHDKD